MIHQDFGPQGYARAQTVGMRQIVAAPDLLAGYQVGLSYSLRQPLNEFSMQRLAISSPHAVLRSLFWLRWVLVLGGVAVVFFGIQTESLLLLLVALGVLVGWNAYTYGRLRSASPPSQVELFFHLLLDAFALTALLYCNGGATNPFVSLYLLPVAIGAVILSWPQAWGLLVICGGLYTLLIGLLLGEHVGHDGGFLQHLVGMWANYWIASVLIVSFSGALARGLRKRDQALDAARAAQMRNEQVVSLGAIAAATVHELGGPLSSIELLAESLSAQPEMSAASRDDLQLMRQQIDVCRTQLDELLQDTGASSPPADWQGYLEHTVQRFRALRPEIQVKVEVEAIKDTPCEPPQGLLLWLLGLLNNAADASLENGQNRISLLAEVDEQRCRIEVIDAGAGLGISEDLGLRPATSKGDGRGWGLLLGHAGIEAAGGDLQLVSEAEGSRAIVTLPLVAT